jgi:hypothetical protein
MKNVLRWLVLFFGASCFLNAQTLTSITVLPPTTGAALQTTTSTVQFSTLCTFSDLSTNNCSTVTLTWGSTSPNDFTVNSTGLITGAGGTATTGHVPDVFAYSGAILGHHLVYVGASTFTTLTTRPEDALSNVVVGSTVLVSAVADTSSDNTPVGDYCAYTTSNAAVATVNYIGEVYGVGAGTANITCTIGSLTVVRAVTVLNPTLLNNTYYVQPLGGTRYDSNLTSGQCNGTTSASYPGSGVNQNCAFNNPMWCSTDNSSNSVYTGAVKAGDTCLISPGTYNIAGFTTSLSGALVVPSGTPTNPTQYLASNYASCNATSAPNYAVGNRVMFLSPLQFPSVNVGDTQNVVFNCIDFNSEQDCNQGLTGYIDWNCPGSTTHNFAFFGDSFSGNIQLVNLRIHGYQNAWTGVLGVGTKIINSSAESNYLDGWNFDDPYGFNGNRSDGLVGTQLGSSFSGCTEEQPKTVTSVSRTGGSITVVFPLPSIVNYLTTTNLVLSGMSPSDLNGTYPVSSIAFNQQSATITGGSITSTAGSGVFTGNFTTSAAPTFVTGSYVTITGATPSYVNGSYEVYSTSGTGFKMFVSGNTHPSWAVATISSGGTASTANTVVATAAGSTESATTVGTASHVYPAHRCMDQNDGGYANGDGIGTGNNTIGSWSCIGCNLRENTQDGWDMLHSSMSSSILTNTFSAGNEGAPAKFGNADYARMTNNVLIANAGALLAFDPNKPADYNQYITTPYRAADGLVLGERAWSNIILQNNVWDSGQPTIIDDFCQDTGFGCNNLTGISLSLIQNNIFLGYSDTNNPSYNGALPAVYYSEGSNPTWTYNNNYAYNTRNPPSGGGSGNQWTTNPLVVQMINNITTFAGESQAVYPNWNMMPTASSPTIRGGISNAYTPTTDFYYYTQTSPATVGPYIYNLGSTYIGSAMSRGTSESVGTSHQ